MRGDYDIDLVVFIQGFEPSKMEVYKQQGIQFLNNAGVSYKKVGSTRFCIKIEVATGSPSKPQLHFDVLFSGDPRTRPAGVDEKFYSAGEAPENDELVINAISHHHGLRELILLCKHWRKQQLWTNTFFSSFYVELTCKEVVERKPTLDLQQGFRESLKAMAEGLPRKKANGTVTIPVEAIEECKRFVGATLKAMGSPFVYAKPTEIRFTQRNVGKDFRNKKSIMDTAIALAKADIEKRDVEMMRAVEHGSQLFTLDNRRLAVFRLLEFAGKTRIVKARVVPKEEKEWKRKFDTEDQGASVKVRGTSYVVGLSAATTTFPLDALRAARPEEALHGLPDMDDESDDEIVEPPPTKKHSVDEFNHASRATYSREVFARGAARVVHRGKYTEGQRTGEECVVKMFKTGSVWENSFFQHDLKVV